MEKTKIFESKSTVFPKMGFANLSEILFQVCKILFAANDSLIIVSQCAACSTLTWIATNCKMQ